MEFIIMLYLFVIGTEYAVKKFYRKNFINLYYFINLISYILYINFIGDL